MHKKTFFILTAVYMSTVISAFRLNGSSSSLMPPPVSVINWHDKMRVLNVRGIYLSMEPTEPQDYAFSIAGAGLVGDANRAFSDIWGININFSIIGMSGKSESIYSRDNMDTFMLSFNPNLVYEAVGGEEKDIAGEIVKDGFSLAVYGGFGFSMQIMGFTQTSKKTGRSEIGDTVAVMMTSFDLGVVMEIPLTYWISLAPSFNITKYISMSMDGESLSGFEFPTQIIYGTDILIRPLKLNPNLKVSLGMLIGLADANTSDDSGFKSTLIMLGIQYEWGKYYSSTFIGPGIAK